MKTWCYIFCLLFFAASLNAQEDSLSKIQRLEDEQHALQKAIQDSTEQANLENRETETTTELPSEMAIVDDLSYRYYLNADWKTLSSYCDKQFDKGIDYFYLRMRAGVSAYEQKYYRSAAVHFSKALEFNSTDDIAKEYLYFSLLYSDRVDEALQLRKQFSTAVLQKLGNTSRSLLLSLASESGLKSTNRSEFDNALFTQLQVQHNVLGAVSLLHSASFFTQHEQRFRVEQAQYYLRASVPIKKGWGLQVAAHLVNMDLTLRQQQLAYSVVTVQVLQPPPNAPRTQTTLIATPITALIPKQTQNYFTAAALTKETKWLSTNIGGSFAKLDTATQVQANVALSFYPLQNNHLIIGANAYLHSEDQNKPVLAYSPFVIARPHPRLYLSANYFSNSGNNISEYSAQFITNSIDYTRDRFNASLWIGLRQHIWLNLNLGHETKTHFTQKYTYAYFIYSAGFKLNFN